MKFRCLLAALALAWVGHSVDAKAQAFLQDPRIAEGLGIKAGNWEVHPGVAGEVGYDSNYFQAAGDRAAPPGREPVYDAWRFRVTPSVSFTSYGRRAPLEGGGPPPTLKLSGNAAVSYNLVAVNDPNDQVAGQSHFAESVNLALDILPGRKVGGDLSAGFVRTVEASNEPDIPNAFRRDTVLGGAGIMWRPGGGLFSWRLGYDVRATFFEEDAFNSMNTLRHGLITTNRWRFLPRTQLVYKGGLHWTSYLNSPQTVGGGQSMDTQIGINGLITNHWGMLALVGWSSTFFSSPNPAVPPQNYDSIVGQAELTWYPMPQPKLLEGERPVGLSSMSVGYHRYWGISYLGEYYQSDRGYAKMVYFFAQRFVFLMTGGLSHITRPPSFFPNGTLQYGGGGENRVDLMAFLEYRISGSVGLNLTYRFSAELTNVVIADAPGSATGDQLMFDRHQVYLGARWFL